MSDFRLIPIENLYWNKKCGMALFQTEKKLEHYIDKLQESIEKSGIQKPPLVTGLGKKKDSGVFGDKKFLVLQGNHRVEVAKRLGWKEVNCEVVSG